MVDQLEGLGIPVLALGTPGEQVGAGRIASTDETWQRGIWELATGARALLVLPATSAGTHWEIDRILHDSGLLRKASFLVPPEESLLGYPGSMGGYFDPGAAPGLTVATRPEWKVSEAEGTLRKGVLSALQAQGIRLSNVPPEGAVVTLRDGGRIGSIRPLLHYRERSTPYPGRLEEMKVVLTPLLTAADLKSHELSPRRPTHSVKKGTRRPKSKKR
jgi:hypothetical protein